MKTDIHPADYRKIIFEDQGSGAQFLIGSTLKTDKVGKFDGKEYPLYVVEISSASHPFYTGKSNTIDRANRIARFTTRSSKAKAKK